MNDALSTILSTMGITLKLEGRGAILTWEGRIYGTADLCLDALSPGEEEAELWAVARGFALAIKNPDRITMQETLPMGAGSVMPRLERARFVRAYDAVIQASGGDLAKDALAYREFGAGLVTAYVQERSWKYNAVSKGRVAMWDTSADVVYSAARSLLYYRAEVDYKVDRVALGDGYDATRAILMDEVFYDRMGPEGLKIAIPSQELLLVGPDISEAEVAEAYAAAKVPVSNKIFNYYRHQVSLA